MDAPNSLQARLRAQREAALAPKRITVDVPGFDGMLAVRYRPIPWDRLAPLLDRQADDPKSALESNAGSLAEACDALIVREDGLEQTLAEALRAQGENVHGEVRFDEYAVEVLDLTVKDETGESRKPKSARETVLALFAGAVSPELAIRDHAGRIGIWMRGIQREVDDSLAGG